MVLKVEKPSEETKPILGSSDAPEKYEADLKVEDAYRYITKSMRAEPLKIEKPELALELFSTAIRMQNVPLAKECADILNRQLNRHNALLVMRHIYNYQTTGSPPADPLDLEPSAPPILESDSQFHEDWAQELVDNLRNNCLLEIDKNADFVLKQKEILELSYKDILAIACRDTLQASNELLVYSAVVRWTVEECKRLTLEPHLSNLKAVLRELLHAPRYGLMSKKDYFCRTVDGVRGPHRNKILEGKEAEIIETYIKKKAKNQPVEELPHKGSLPRKVSNETAKAFRAGVSGSSACSAASSCDRFVINFLTCWTAIFD